MKAPTTLSSAIREILSKHLDLTPTEVLQHLKDGGHSIQNEKNVKALISNIKSREKSKAIHSNSGNGVARELEGDSKGTRPSLLELEKAQEIIEQFGGWERAVLIISSVGKRLEKYRDKCREEWEAEIKTNSIMEQNSLP